MSIGRIVDTLQRAPFNKSKILLRGVLIQFRDFFAAFSEVNGRPDFLEIYDAVLDGGHGRISEDQLLEMVSDPCEETVFETEFSRDLVGLLHALWENSTESINAGLHAFGDLLLYENAHLVWSAEEVATRLDHEQAALSEELEAVLAPHVKFCIGEAADRSAYFDECKRSSDARFFTSQETIR